MSKRHVFLAVALLGGLIIGVLVGPSSAASYTPLAKIKPDVVLSPGQSHTFRGKTALIGNPALGGDPSICRGKGAGGDPVGLIVGLSCSVFRIRLKIDPNPEAMNVVFIRADFDQVKLPVINIPQVAPLELTPLNGLDVFVFNTADNTVRTGAASYGVPEVGSFLVGQPEYDIVVQSDPGINRGFTLKLTFSNELFPPALELGEPAQLLPSLLDPPEASAFPAGIEDVLPLPKFFDDQPVNTDADIAGVGLGVTEQFDATALDALNNATRGLPSEPAPSGVALIGGLVVVPAVAILGVGFALRRRRHALI